MIGHKLSGFVRAGIGLLGCGWVASGWGQTSDTLAPVGMEDRWHALPVAEIEGLGLAAGAGAWSGVPGSLHVIPARELGRWGYSDPMRALRGVSGMQLQEEDGWGLRPNIGIRGSGSERSTRVTVMEDGILAAPAAYSAPAAYYFPSLPRMSQIEVLKGSGQIAFGPRTAGGAIDFRSTPIPEGAVGGRLRLEAASWEGGLAYVQAGGNAQMDRGTLGYLVEHLRWGSGGFKELPDGGPTGFDKEDVMLKVRWRPVGRAGARFQQCWEAKLLRAQETSHETYLGLSEGDFARTPRARYAATQEDEMVTDWRQAGMHHTLKWEGSGALWVMESDVYGTAFDRNWYKLDRMVDSLGNVVALGLLFTEPEAHEAVWAVVRGATGSGAAGLDVRANARTYYSRGVQTRLSRTWKDVHGVEQRWTVGLRWHADGMDRSEWRDRYRMEDGNMVQVAQGVPGSAANAVTGASAASGWARLHWARGRWVITPGVRAEHMVFEQVQFGTSDVDRRLEGARTEHAVQVVLPGVGVHRDAGNWGSFFGGVHRGFVPPGVQPGARPEYSIQGEGGVRASGRGWAVQAAVFSSRYTDMLGTDLTAVGGSGSGDLFNGGAAWTSGCEWEVAWDPMHASNRSWNLPIRASYAWTVARFTEAFDADFDAWGSVQAGDEMPYVAPHQASLQVAWESTRCAFDWSGRHLSAMRTVAGQGPLSDRDFTPAVTVWDAGFRVEPAQGWSVRCTVQNVFDSDYLVARRPFGARPGLPRMFRVGVELAF